MPAVEEGRDHVGLHRAGTKQRDVDDEVGPFVRLELLQELPLAGRLDLEAPERVGAADQLERCRVAERYPLEVDLLVLRAGDLVDRVAHRREHPHAQDVELEQTEELDVVLVGLDHPVALERALEGHPPDEVAVGEHDAGWMQREVPGEPVQSLDDPKERVELPRVQVHPAELGQVVHRLADVVRTDVRKGLRHQIDLALGQAERLADLADRAARPVRVDHRHAGAAIVAVPGEDRVVDVLAASGLHVDVDVGELRTERVQEPFEQQVVAHGVDVGDPREIAHERPGRRAPARAADPHRPDVVGDLGDGEEVGRVAHGLDERELVVQSVPDPLRRPHPSLGEPVPAPLGEDRARAPSRGRRELREVDPAEPDVEPASVRDLERAVAELGSLGEERPHLAR